MARALSEASIEALKEIVGPRGWLDAKDDKAPYLVDVRELYRGKAPLVLRPASTDEVSKIVAFCSQAGIGIVPQGGNTGHVGGGVPDESGDQILLSLSRMNRVRDRDPSEYTMTVEAGCILADVQQAAAEVDRFFPLSLAAEGSCEIGGNLSTNAGGITVLRYGNARDLVLGLEVVLPDGTVWDGLRRLRKDNRGYDLKQLFLGAEGTLGVITAAVLKLFPRPRETQTLLVSVIDPNAALALLAAFRERSGDLVTSFEYIHRDCFDLLFETVPECSDPFDKRYDHYVLIELAASGSGADLQSLAEVVVGSALERGQVLDAVMASSTEQAERLWHMREAMPEAQKRGGATIKHDVSVPVSKVPALLEAGTACAHALIPGVRVIPFGHMGDGNIHFNLVQAPEMDRALFLAHARTVNDAIHDIVADLGGSFSAEHGVGRLKRAELRRYKSATEIELMEKIKAVLDPQGIMNPGKVL